LFDDIGCLLRRALQLLQQSAPVWIKIDVGLDLIERPVGYIGVLSAGCGEAFVEPFRTGTLDT